MLIASIKNNEVEQVADYKVLFPEVSFPQSGPDLEWLKDNSALPVTAFKSYDASIEKLEVVAPYIEGDEVFTVSVVAKTAEEIAAESEVAKAKLQSAIVSQVQVRLDTFAQTRNYDSILSAATYAASSNEVFKAEGLKAVELRDATWSALYTILAAVEAGTRVVESYADIEADLPVLSWN